MNNLKKFIESIILVVFLAILESMYVYKYFPIEHFRTLVLLCSAINGYIGMVIYALRTKEE